MSHRKKWFLIAFAALLICSAGITSLFITSNSDKRPKGNMIVRKATPEEIKNAETAKYVDAIVTKFGTFRYTADEPIPSEGVVYDLSDIN